MCTRDVTFSHIDAMENISRLVGLSQLLPSRSTQVVDRKEKPFQNTPLRAWDGNEINQWPTALDEVPSAIPMQA